MNINNPIESGEQVFYLDEHGQYWDEDPYEQGLRKPKRFVLSDLVRREKYGEPVRIINVRREPGLGDASARVDANFRAMAKSSKRNQAKLEKEWKAQQGAK